MTKKVPVSIGTPLHAVTDPRLTAAGTDSAPTWLQAYGACVTALAGADPTQCDTALVATLQARDLVAKELSELGLQSAQVFLAVSQHDARLQALATKIERAIGVRAIQRLARSAPHTDARWWWKLDEQLRRSWPLTVLSALLFAAAVSLLAEIGRRFFAEGPDVTGAIYTLLQAGFTLLAGSTLLGTGGNAFDKWLDRRDIRRRFHPFLKIALAAVTFLIVFGGFRLLLPRIAGTYVAAGVTRDRSGEPVRAIQNFRRALSLSPDFPQAYYNLGRAYESVLDHESAAAEYQKAIKAEPKLYPAYNSLARLYIVEEDNGSGALGLIDQAIKLTEQDRSRDADTIRQARFALFKNRGWANLVSENYWQALSDLDAALALDPQRASAHCLRALVREKRNEPGLPDWEICLGRSTGATDVEPVWLATAQDRILRATEVQP